MDPPLTVLASVYYVTFTCRPVVVVRQIKEAEKSNRLHLEQAKAKTLPSAHSNLFPVISEEIINITCACRGEPSYYLDPLPLAVMYLKHSK